MTTNGKHNGGRPKKPIDWKEAEKLCHLQCSELEIADWFGITEDTLTRRLKDEKGMSFREFFTKYRAYGKIALRRNLWKLSEKQGHVAIFMAKNWLGMVDKQEISGEGGGPVEVTIDVKQKLTSILTRLASSQNEGTGNTEADQ